jgi:hypothetical protein
MVEKQGLRTGFSRARPELLFQKDKRPHGGVMGWISTLPIMHISMLHIWDKTKVAKMRKFKAVNKRAIRARDNNCP